VADLVRWLAVGAQAQPGGEPADGAHRRPGQNGCGLQRQVAAAGGHRLQEHDRGGAHREHRGRQGPRVERVLADTVAGAFCARVACQAGGSGEGPGTAAGPGVLMAARFRTR
jgi:hypothetical protein